MTLFYGLAIAIGAGGVLAAVLLALNRERAPLNRELRSAVLGFLGFGLAGMSTSFAGWHDGFAIVAAIGGAAALIAMGARYSEAERE